MEPGVRSTLMPQFEVPAGEADPRQPMTDWINTAHPADLAVELIGAFGTPGVGHGEENFMGYDKLVEWMYRGHPAPKPKMIGFSRSPSVLAPISEAIQLLENSELVVNLCRLYSSGAQLHYVATRLGMATLANGKAAVRERIRERTGL
jgi:hypothetical protein